MRDVNEGDAGAPLQRAQLLLKFLAQIEVERGQRLVEQQDLRFVHERAGQGHALLLTAGELRGLARGEFGDADQFHDATHARFDFCARNFFHAQAEGDVLSHAQVREQRVALKHGVDLTLVRRHARDITACELQFARVGKIESGEQSQQRGLAATRRAEQGKEFSARHREGDGVERGHVAEPAREIHGFDGRSGGGLHCGERVAEAQEALEFKLQFELEFKL